jgi:hypothetical protein
MVKNIEIVLDQDGKLGKITTPLLSKYGIYVIRQGNNIIRIGESSSGFDRISKGFKQPLRHIRRGKEKKNYLAYSWRINFTGKTLLVDYFDLNENPFSENHLRRALEAEITFQFRIMLRTWPQHMSEIHFLERYRTHPMLVQQASAVMLNYGHQYNIAV